MADKNFNQENQSRHYNQDWDRERNRSNQDADWSSQRYGNTGYNNRQDMDQDRYNRVNYLPDNDENRDLHHRDYDNSFYGTSGTQGYSNDRNRDQYQGGYSGENRNAFGNTGYQSNSNINRDQRNDYGSTYGNTSNDSDWNRRSRQQGGNNNWGSDYGRQNQQWNNPNSGYNQWENQNSGYGNRGGLQNRDWDNDRYANNNRNRQDNDWWDRTKNRASSWFSDDDDNRNRSNTGMHRGKGPSNYRRSEERIREDICDRLTDDDRVDASGISVQMENDAVILSGTVNSREEKRRAEELVESVSGVRDVENRLRIGGNVLTTHEYTGNTDNAGGIGNQSGTTNEIIRDVQNEQEGNVRKGRTKHT